MALCVGWRQDGGRHKLRPLFMHNQPSQSWNFHLLFALVERDFKAQYRRSMLGPLWAVLQPLMYMVIFTFLRSVLDIQTNGVPYVIFSFSALVPWTFFANAITRATPSVYINGPIVKKMRVQAELFPLAAVILSLLDFLISFLILLAMMAWFATPLTAALLWLPVLILNAALLALGLGLGSASFGTFRRDIIFAIPFVLQFLMLATPIIYPLSKVPAHLHTLVALNPMVGVIEGFRAVIIHGAAPDLYLLSISFAVTGLIWLVTWPLFRFVSGYYADAL